MKKKFVLVLSIVAIILLLAETYHYVSFKLRSKPINNQRETSSNCKITSTTIWAPFSECNGRSEPITGAFGNMPIIAGELLIFQEKGTKEDFLKLISENGGEVIRTIEDMGWYHVKFPNKQTGKELASVEEILNSNPLVSSVSYNSLMYPD